MAEPSLIVDGKEDDVVYRFLLARSFHSPLAIRVERRKGKATLTAKHLGGRGGYNSPIEANVRRDLTDAEWTHAESALSAVPFTREPFDGSVLSNDGSDWVLERARDGRYLATSRHSPDADMPLRHACEILLDLAGRNILNGDLY